MGLQGDQGDPGDTGPTGPQGDPGGPTGPTGPALELCTEIICGQGNPAMDAPLGTLYINTSGGLGVTLWVKELAGASGWRSK